MAIQHAASLAQGVLSAVGGGGATSGLTDRKQFDAVTNPIVDSSQVFPAAYAGAYSFALGDASSSVAHSASWTISDQTFAVGFWFQLHDLKATALRLFRTTGSTHDLRISSGGTVQVGPAAANYVNVFTPSVDTPYWITMSVDTSGTTHTLVVQAYNANLASVASPATATLAGQVATNQTAAVFGCAAGSVGQISYMTGMVLDDTATLIKPRKVHLLKPNADGTHSFTNGTPDDFQNATPADYPSGNASTTIWNDVKEVPPNTTAFVQQKVSRTAGYVEFAFEDLPAVGYAAPELVQLWGAYHPVGAQTANNSATRLNDSGTITAEATIDRSVATDTLEYARHGYQTRPNGGGAWDATSVNALLARYGFSTDIAPPPALDALYLEVVTPISQSGTAALTNTASISAAATRNRFAAAAIANTASITAAGVRTRLGAAALTNTASLTASGTATTPSISGTAALTNTASLSATGVRTRLGAAALSNTASLIVAGVRTRLGSAALTNTASSSITGVRTRLASAALTNTASLTASGTVTRPGVNGAASLTNTASLSASGVRTRLGAASLTNTASTTVAGVRTRLGIATLTNTASLSAAGRWGAFTAAHLVNTPALLAGGTRTAYQSAALTNTSSLTAAGEHTGVGEAQLWNSASLTAIGEAFHADPRIASFISSIADSSRFTSSTSDTMSNASRVDSPMTDDIADPATLDSAAPSLVFSSSVYPAEANDR